MKTPTAIKSLCAGILASALSAYAGIHPLPTPPPSEFADAESSVTVPLPANEGRHIRLTLAFDPSPTNAVQVAFGTDANHDNDLAPEETAVRVGCDCSPGPLTFTLKQPKAASSRWTHAKVTTHNLATTNLTVTALFHSTGLAITLK